MDSGILSGCLVCALLSFASTSNCVMCGLESRKGKRDWQNRMESSNNETNAMCEQLMLKTRTQTDVDVEFVPASTTRDQVRTILGKPLSPSKHNPCQTLLCEHQKEILPIDLSNGSDQELFTFRSMLASTHLHDASLASYRRRR